MKTVSRVRRWLGRMGVVMLALAVWPAAAAEKVAELSVPGMSCAACPITVKKALKQVDGVLDVEVDYPGKRATVRYEDTRIKPEALIQATTHVGYPSTLIEPSDGAGS